MQIWNNDTVLISNCKQFTSTMVCSETQAIYEELIRKLINLFQWYPQTSHFQTIHSPWKNTLRCEKTEIKMLVYYIVPKILNSTPEKLFKVFHKVERVVRVNFRLKWIFWQRFFKDLFPPTTVDKSIIYFNL